jgi:hypothetical protein
MIYKDSHGVTIKEGDILKYEEQYNRSIEEAVLVTGELHTRTHVGYPKWTKKVNSVVIPIQFMGENQKLDNETIKIISFKIIGDIANHPERLESNYAETLWNPNPDNVKKEDAS